MIYLYSGTPGSGKSLHVAKDVLIKVGRGQNVIANFDINRKMIKGKRKGRFYYIDNSFLTPKLLMQYARKFHRKGKEGQTLLIIDECAVMFNSREWDKNDRKDWIKFFQVHRHYGFNVILISQSDRLIDRQIRAFVEYDVKHRKANNLGVIGLVLSLLRFQLFAAVTYWYGVREKCGVEFFTYKRKLGEFYDSYSMFDGELS